MLQFTQEEIEQEIADILKHGDRHDIAKITGISETYIKRQFNPADAEPSAVYRALQIICALDEISEARGDELFQKIVEFRELSKKRKAGTAQSSLSIATGKLNREVAEYVAARLEGKPFHEQFTEFLDIEAQLAAVKQSLLDEYNHLKSESPERSLKIAGMGNN